MIRGFRVMSRIGAAVGLSASLVCAAATGTSAQALPAGDVPAAHLSTATDAVPDVSIDPPMPEIIDPPGVDFPDEDDPDGDDPDGEDPDREDGGDKHVGGNNEDGSLVELNLPLLGTVTIL
jgi:hypothetical protein